MFAGWIKTLEDILKDLNYSAAETWPFLIKLLVHCALSETSASKRRSPKQIFAKTLRLAVQRAEDSTCSGLYHCVCY